MKYCVPYNRNFKYLTEVDEVIIPFNESLDFFKALVEKRRLYQNRIIISIEDLAEFNENKESYIPMFLELKEKNKFQIAIRFDIYSQQFLELYKELKEKEINFFFGTYVRDWEVFRGFIELGVSDVYIVESLAFELNLLGPAAHASQVLIRVFANVCQSSWSESNTLKSFFIRPEDVPIYEPYVDVIEFYGDSQSTYYKVYAKDKKWYGDLNDLIIGLNQSLDSRRIISQWANQKVKCGKKCLKGSPCRLCERVAAVEKTLVEKKLILKTPSLEL